MDKRDVWATAWLATLTLCASCTSTPRLADHRPFEGRKAERAPRAAAEPSTPWLPTSAARRGAASALVPELVWADEPVDSNSRDSIDYDGDGDVDEEDLARATQNPVADLISLPFQNNLGFDFGEDDDLLYNLNVQPVIPMSMSDDWNLIHRIIVPFIDLPEVAPGVGDVTGLGDVDYTAFLSPATPGEVIWGVGPVMVFPTATDSDLGSDKFSMGPSVVALTMRGAWVGGVLAKQVWDVAGDSDEPHVSRFLAQPFVNYNLDDGWYLVSSPVITADWSASSDDRWLVPLGGGAGRVFTIGGQPMNASIQAFYNVENPDVGPEWSLRIQLQALFPKSR